MAKTRQCKDCGSTTRTLPNPGPRCATCWRAVKKARSAASHARRVEDTYSLTSEAYKALYEAQGGFCFVCRRANGSARRLSVDHDHRCCPGPTSCGRCVRALLCRPCNDLLGHVRDDIETLKRAAIVIRDHPAQEILQKLGFVQP